MYRVAPSGSPGFQRLRPRGRGCSGRRRRRQGVVAVLAMVYLVLFATLAIGAYAAITRSSQASYNQRDLNAARAAAESGMEFIRLQLYKLDIPHNTLAENMFTTVYQQLSTNLNGTLNLRSNDVVGIDPTGTVITIPSRGMANPILLTDDDKGPRFVITITKGDNQELVVKTVGIGSQAVSLGRGVQMNFAVAKRPSTIFNYGVSSRGSIAMNGNTMIQGPKADPAKGSVMSADTSATPVTMSGSTSISGDISLVNTAGQVKTTGSPTIGNPPVTPAMPGWSQDIITGIEPPIFPQIDTSTFKTFATNPYIPGATTLVNVSIPANTGNVPLSGNTIIQGVLYIGKGNTLNVTGNLTVQGVIVVEPPTDPDPATALLLQQQVSTVLNFGGNVTAQSLSTLPATAQFPAEERNLQNIFLLAPGAQANFTGDFGTVGGTMIAAQFNFSGNAGGVVNGSIVGLGPLPMSIAGSSNITINSSSNAATPSGVFFGQNYAPRKGSWLEVRP